MSLRIRRIYIDGFGTFHDVDIKGLDHNMTVFYGLNESGKSTLAAFVKAILFGFERNREPSLTHRYEPVNGGRHGGLIEIEDFDGSVYVVERYSDRGTKYEGTVTVRWEDKVGGSEVLESILGNISKKFYSKVFAFDSQDLADLNSLNDAEVKTRVYSIGTGLPTDALIKAQSVLKGRRDGLYKASGVRPEVNRILSEIHALEDRMERGSVPAGKYEKVRAKVDELELRTAEARDCADEVNRTRTWLESIMKEIRVKSDEVKRVVPGDTAKLQVQTESGWAYSPIRRRRPKASMSGVVMPLALSGLLLLLVIYGLIYHFPLTVELVFVVCSVSFFIWGCTNSSYARRSGEGRLRRQMGDAGTVDIPTGDIDGAVQVPLYDIDEIKSMSTGAKSLAVSAIKSFLGEEALKEVMESFQGDLQFVGHVIERLIGLEESYRNDMVTASKDVEMYKAQLKEMEREDELRAKLKSDFAALKAELRVKVKEFVTVSLCDAMMNDAHNRFKRDRQPTVSMYASKVFNTATMDRYPEVVFPKDEDMKDIEVRDEHLRQFHATSLSKGTRDQLYLAMRFGLIYEYVERLEGLPVIMDDVLGDCDDLRVRSTIRAVCDLSDKCQVFMFTCHSHIKDAFVQAGRVSGLFEIEDGKVSRVEALI